MRPTLNTLERRRSWRPPGDPTLRHRVGPYRLCLKIGEGGMASVYLARTDAGAGSQRPLAVKIIHPHLATDRAFLDMFIDEAEIASRIHHVNVCSVVDFGGDEEGHYMAMEYIVGEPLLAIWRRLSRAYPSDVDGLARRLAHLLASVCEGLHAAHELADSDGEPLHVVHRDVSPENIFLRYDGIVKIVDFGVASALHKRHRTRTGMVKGKFAYVAPEMLKGAKADRRSDIWSVGVIAWELLTGRRLFRQESDLDTLRAVSDSEITPPSEIHSGIPKELDEIVMRALRRDVDERYSTARELGQDLAAFAADGPFVITTAELGRWLEELFPAGHARHEQAIEFATKVDVEGAGQAEVENDVTPRLRTDAPPPLEYPARSVEASSPSTTAPPSPGRTYLLVGSVAVACAALGLAGGVVLSGGSRDAALAPTPVAAVEQPRDDQPPPEPQELVIRLRLESEEPPPEEEDRRPRRVRREPTPVLRASAQLSPPVSITQGQPIRIDAPPRR